MNKTVSIDNLYVNLDKHILLAQSYMEMKELSFIIRSCRLKPQEHIFESQSKKIVLFKWWFDEFGNSLKILKGKKLQIICNDLLLDRNKIISTDLYQGIALDKITKISKIMMFNFLKEDELHNSFIITYYGIDGYLRSYHYQNGQFYSLSPLVLGIDNLKNIYDNLGLEFFRNITKVEKILVPCQTGEAWITSLPVNQDFINLMEKQYNINLSFMLEKEI